MNKRKAHERLNAKEHRNSLQNNAAQGSVPLLFTNMIINMKDKSNDKTEVTENPFSPSTAEASVNLNATHMFMLHPDFHADLYKEMGTDTTDPAAMARALADEANERLSDRAILIQHRMHSAEKSGVKSAFVNGRMTPSLNQGNANRTHYVKPVIGGPATDPEVKAAREFANAGLPDVTKNTTDGQGWFWGGGSMHTFQYNGGDGIEAKRNTAKPRAKKS